MKKHLIGLVVAALVVVVPASSASASGQLALRVRPSTDLTDGQVVTVKGRGFTPSAPNIVVAECVAEAVTADDCDVVNVVFTHASSTGSFIARFPVMTHITTLNQGRIRCESAPGRCIVVGANFDNQVEAFGAPISFAPAS